jgi:hypothetical protein
MLALKQYFTYLRKECKLLTINNARSSDIPIKLSSVTTTNN